MLLTVEFDRGNGIESLVIGPAAQMGWEKRTGKSISNLAQGAGTTDLVIMTLEQMRVEGTEPLPLPKPEAFAQQLKDINPRAGSADPTETGAPEDS